MNLPDRDGDGYLTDMGAWTEEIGRAMADADGYELDDAKWAQIIKARDYYEEFSSVPPIRIGHGPANLFGPRSHVREVSVSVAIWQIHSVYFFLNLKLPLVPSAA